MLRNKMLREQGFNQVNFPGVKIENQLTSLEFTISSVLYNIVTAHQITVYPE